MHTFSRKHPDHHFPSPSPNSHSSLPQTTDRPSQSPHTARHWPGSPGRQKGDKVGHNQLLSLWPFGRGEGVPMDGEGGVGDGVEDALLPSHAARSLTFNHRKLGEWGVSRSFFRNPFGLFFSTLAHHHLLTTVMASATGSPLRAPVVQGECSWMLDDSVYESASGTRSPSDRCMVSRLAMVAPLPCCSRRWRWCSRGGLPGGWQGRARARPPRVGATGSWCALWPLLSR